MLHYRPSGGEAWCGSPASSFCLTTNIVLVNCPGCIAEIRRVAATLEPAPVPLVPEQVNLEDLPPGAEFWLTDRPRAYGVWHVTNEVKVIAPLDNRRPPDRRPNGPAVRVMDRRGRTKWLAPDTPVIIRPPNGGGG